MINILPRSVRRAAAAIAHAPTVFKNEKDRLMGKAVSQAVRVRTLKEIDKNALQKKGATGAAKPTDYMIRMKDGRPMRYFSDGSLRHALPGGKPSGKVMKKARRAAREAAVRQHAA